jgi:GNAT superfamily N-acetyltransferase
MTDGPAIEPTLPSGRAGGAGTSLSVVEIVEPAERSRTCDRILRSLPEWFGIAEAIDAYVREVAALRTLACEDAGFLALKTHSPYAAEIHVMGVLRERQGQGIGTALVDDAEERLRREGVEYLQVKTLGPSRPSAHYERTRAFYEKVGFRPLEEIHGLWSEGNPCLVMVKRLPS